MKDNWIIHDHLGINAVNKAKTIPLLLIITVFPGVNLIKVLAAFLSLSVA
jgi:hypothetical protein